MKLKVFIENDARAYANMFLNNGWEVVTSIEEADLLQLIGGSDISPKMYGEEAHPSTHYNPNGDNYTMSLCQEAEKNNIPIAGICRGSQFLCALGGGKLWQHVDGHARGEGHSLIDVETGIFIEECSSTHHQQHRPASNAIIIATSFPQLSTKKANGNGEFHVVPYAEDFLLKNHHLIVDVESFYYPDINALGFQPHPEFFDVNHPCQKYYFDIIAKYLKLRA